MPEMQRVPSHVTTGKAVGENQIDQPAVQPVNSHDGSPPTRGEKWETRIQVAILLGMGGMAGAVSFVHVHDWTVQHGQLSWVGWTNALVTELIQIAGGLEIRRRQRAGQKAGFVTAVLLVAVALSLTAQVAQAEGSVFGWIVAALPAVGFLAVVKIVMTRSAVKVRTAATDQVEVRTGDRAMATAVREVRPEVRTSDLGPDRAGDLGPGTGPGPAIRTADDLDKPLDLDPGPAVRSGPPDETGRPDTRAVPGPDRDTVEVRSGRDRASDLVDLTLDLDPRTGPEVRTGDRGPDLPDLADLGTGPGDPVRSRTLTAVRTGTPTADLDPDLMDRGRTALADLTRSGTAVTRSAFAQHLRASGQPIATTTAGQLLRALREATAS